MQRATLVSLPDVLHPADVADFLGVGYAKALSIVKYGGLIYLRVGNVYLVTKKNFTDWLDVGESRVIKFN